MTPEPDEWVRLPPNGWGMSGVLRAGLLVLMLAGCSGEDEGSDDCVASVCNIQDADCQLRIFRATVCERGDRMAVMPPVRAITSSEFADELNARLAGDADAVVWEAALKQLGLLPATTTLNGELTAASVASVAAYYDASTQGVTVIRNPAGNPVEDLFLLSHEFTHALQDQGADIFSLRQERVRSTDAFVALTSLIEGEATVIGLAVAARAQGRTPEQLLWDNAVRALWDATLQSIEDASAPFVTALQGLPYPLGTDYLAPRWLAYGRSALEEHYAAPLSSVLDWRSDIQVNEASLVEPLDCHPTTPPPGYVPFDSDQLGATGLLGLWAATGRAASSAWADSIDWRGDSLVVFRSDAGSEVATAWRIRWRSETDASEFAASLAGRIVGPSQVDVQGREVTLWTASDAQVLAAWLPIECGAVTSLPMRPEASTTSTGARRWLHPGAFHPRDIP